jgi:EAL and modified HD-GYP domain-containing signal transduction protein
LCKVPTDEVLTLPDQDGTESAGGRSRMTSEVFLGRQSIVDAEREIFGYELLYRGSPDQLSAFDDPDAATRCVMERVFLQWGMEQVVGDRFGLMNASASLIVNGLHEAMPPEGMIIEVREPEPFDDDTVNALRQARVNGYHFALDNVNRVGDLEHSTLLPLASIVKIELTTAHRGELDRLIAVARDRSPGVLVVAEKVESQDEFNWCIDHGFDLFQGYHLREPEVLRRPARRATRRSAEALREALTAEINVSDIEAIVASDPSLTFRLLIAVNANAFGLNRTVTTLDEAISMLGISSLRRLADLLASSSDAVDDHSVDHADAVLRGATRADMMSWLLADTDLDRCGVTAALLSVVDRLYDDSLGALIGELPMSDSTVRAVLHGAGPVGEALDIVRACEQDDRALLETLAPGRSGELIEMHASAMERAQFARLSAEIDSLEHGSELREVT